MVMIIVIYLVSMLLSIFTIPIFAEKDIGIATGMFLLFTPIINLLWALYCFIKTINNDRLNFISDLKKLFDIN